MAAKSNIKINAAVSPAEIAALEHLLASDPILHSLAVEHPGTILSRVTPKKTNKALFKALCSSIVSQQLSTKAANSIFKRLEESANGTITPEYIADAKPETLRAAGLSAAKVKTLQELSNATQSGSLNLLALKKLSAEEAIATLTSIWGIGPWTAEMFLIFALGSPDVFSAGDLILARMMVNHKKLPESTKTKELATIAAQWSPHRSFVSLLFWKLNDMKK